MTLRSCIIFLSMDILQFNTSVAVYHYESDSLEHSGTVCPEKIIWMKIATCIYICRFPNQASETISIDITLKVLIWPSFSRNLHFWSTIFASLRASAFFSSSLPQITQPHSQSCHLVFLPNFPRTKFWYEILLQWKFADLIPFFFHVCILPKTTQTSLALLSILSLFLNSHGCNARYYHIHFEQFGFTRVGAK